MYNIENKCKEFEDKLTEGERLLNILYGLKLQVNEEIEQCKEEANYEIDRFIESISGVNKTNKNQLKALKHAVYIMETSDWRDAVLMRDKFSCQRCGSNQSLTVHHIIPKEFKTEFTNNVNNGITLCRECHDKWHKSHDNSVGMHVFIKWLNLKE